MYSWMIAALVIGATVVGALIARTRGRHASQAARDPQNIYPLW